MFVFNELIVTIIKQDGVRDNIVVRNDLAVDNDATTVTATGWRRRTIETIVPEYFFANPSKGLVVDGIGVIIMNGNSGEIRRSIPFSIPLTLLAQPSDSPSTHPSSSSSPTFVGPPERHTQSSAPSFNPSKSIMPTEEQTIRLDSCPCDDRNICLPAPVTLPSTTRSIKICLTASPSNAQLTEIEAVEKERLISLETRLSGNFAVVTGEISEDFFDSGPTGVVILGKAEILVREGNKRSEAGFRVEYKPDFPTALPSGNPTISIAPTEVPPLGVRACQCNANFVCDDDQVHSYNSRDASVCIWSTPPGSQIVNINALFFEMRETEESPPIHSQPVVSNNQVAAGNTDISGAPQIITIPDNERFKAIKSRMNEEFFLADTGGKIVNAKGFATVSLVGGLGSRKLTASIVEISVSMPIGPEPSDVPSFAPSTVPSEKPTKQPTHSPTGQPTTSQPTSEPSTPPTAQPTSVSDAYFCVEPSFLFLRLSSS